jgi:hypothetical protein
VIGKAMDEQFADFVVRIGFWNCMLGVGRGLEVLDLVDVLMPIEVWPVPQSHFMTMLSVSFLFLCYVRKL